MCKSDLSRPYLERLLLYLMHRTLSLMAYLAKRESTYFIITCLLKRLSSFYRGPIKRRRWKVTSNYKERSRSSEL